MHILLATLAATLCAQPEPPARAGALLIEHVNLLAMDRERVLEDRNVLVRDGRIESLDAQELPADA